MDDIKIARIKEAVKSNFDDSPAMYQEFEDMWGFFRKLNGTLLDKMDLKDGAKILDVGCGTGASSKQMLDRLPDSRVWGLDISPRMLEMARRCVGESSRLEFVEGDAAKLTEIFQVKFDAVVYSASIFLIPDYAQSLRQALDLLNDDGRVGLSFMEGIFGPAGENLVALANEQDNIGASLKRPVQIDAFMRDFSSAFPVHRVWVEDFQPTIDELRRFFSVPAMSAGLFPALPYDERMGKVDFLFRLLQDKQPCFRWRIMVGTKSP